MSITALATAVVTKGPFYKKDRYKVELYLDEIKTGLEWNVNKRELDGVCNIITTQTREVLQSYGKLDEVLWLLDRKAAEDKGVKLPKLGTLVEITTNSLGQFERGTQGTVVRSDWTPGLADSHQFPVSIRPTGGGEHLTIPLAIGEWKEL